jgi:hypothetical protein
MIPQVIPEALLVHCRSIQRKCFQSSYLNFSLQSSNQRAHPRESHRTLRDGPFGVALTQALRARLRSACPSGTKAICPSKTRIKLAFMPLRPGAWQRRGGRREEKRRTEHRRDASAACLPKVVGSRGVLPSRNVQTPVQARRAWPRSCCPSGTKYILLQAGSLTYI